MAFARVLTISLAAILISACSNAPSKPRPVIIKEQKASTASEQTVIYRCDEKILKAMYAFEGKTPISATIYLNEQRIVREMPLNDSVRNSVGFKLDNFTWLLSSDFSPENATKANGIALSNGTRTLATNCVVDALGTEKANQ